MRDKVIRLFTVVGVSLLVPLIVSWLHNNKLIGFRDPCSFLLHARLFEKASCFIISLWRAKKLHVGLHDCLHLHLLHAEDMVDVICTL